MSDTPRTDALEVMLSIERDLAYAYAQLSRHTRNLERENSNLAAALRQIVDCGADDAGNGYVEITMPGNYINEAHAAMGTSPHRASAGAASK